MICDCHCTVQQHDGPIRFDFRAIDLVASRLLAREINVEIKECIVKEMTYHYINPNTVC